MPDQAHGLRRLFARSLVRTVAFAPGTPGMEGAALLGHVAVAMARRGQGVCVLEQGAAGAGVAARLGVTLRHDLADVLRGQRPLDEVLRHGPEGVRFLAASAAGRLLRALTPDEESRLTGALARLDPPVDLLLLDAPPAHAVDAPPWAVAASEIVVVAGAGAEGVTDAYGLIKRLCRDAARRRFHVVVWQAADEAQALAVCDNLAATARRFLSASVAWLGWVPQCPSMARAAQLNQAVSWAFPESGSAAAIGELADRLLAWPYPGEDGLDDFVHRLVQASRSPADPQPRIR